jgi:hypothetical protein
LEDITGAAKFVSLTDFIEQSGWQYSDVDIVDRCEIKHLDAENFWRYIGESETPLEEPGHLSPVTVAKVIEYGVGLLGCFIEGYVSSDQALAKEADFGKLTRGALEFARGTFATCVPSAGRLRRAAQCGRLRASLGAGQAGAVPREATFAAEPDLLGKRRACLQWSSV